MLEKPKIKKRGGINVFAPIDVGNLPPYAIYDPLDYKDGPEGMIQWCEENVWIPIYPEGSDIPVWCAIKNLPNDKNPQTGRSYMDIWEGQKGVLRHALRMINGRFIYTLIILCWMRGEGKSLLACLIQLWKFFNWPRQQIVLGANSKDQVAFVHFDIMRDIILNSPKLLTIVGKRNVLDKRIRLKDDKGYEVSVVRAISSFSGIVSNITGYTFSEIFDMKNPKFFIQLDGSIRNIPNALGVIDSTVSSKQHILYSLFNSVIKKESKTTYFSYRFSRKGLCEDYWNPNMTQAQLDDYRAKFPLGDYERYFLNIWGSGTEKVFTEDMLEAMNVLGVDGLIGNHEEVMKVVEQKRKYYEFLGTMLEHDLGKNTDLHMKFLQKTEARITPINSIYKLDSQDITSNKLPCMATLSDLLRLGDIFDTDWSILMGLDRADPMKGTKLGARTILCCVAKGLPGSRTTPYIYDSQKMVPHYIYLLLYLSVIENHSLEDIKEGIFACHKEYDGVDLLSGERWGIWDLGNWCEEQQIKLEVYFPAYDKQKAAFTELYLAVAKGRFKTPPIAIWGSKQEDILKEEAGIFYHDSDRHWFGSPEKGEKFGIQDDVMFSLAWCIFGGKNLSVSDFRKREGNLWFGTLFQNKDLIGDWR